MSQITQTLPKVKEHGVHHLGVILDGNRRFAKRLMLEPWNGHKYGANKVRDFLEWSRDAGIQMLTLYCFSVENFSRPEKEFNYLMELFRKEFARLRESDSEIHQNKIRVRFIGRTHLFSQDIQDLISELEEETKEYDQFQVNFAMAYGGRTELIDAMREIAERVKKGELNPTDIDSDTVEEHLYLSNEPEFIIRTSGEKRMSGFLMWQGAYSEFYFSDKLWPEFDRDDFIEALNDFSTRKRRFGK